MEVPYRKNSMMAMLDAKPAEGSAERNGEQYWNGLGDDRLSPIRKNLISAYLQVPDGEAMPLLGEYFGVALSFVALGALVRASNSTKRKHKKTSEEERLDLRSCSRFQRMALESMLKESMERLRILSLNAFQMEERVRNLVEENVAQDRERVQLLTSLAAAEKGMRDLKELRRAEGRANERVMGIVADKEQEWLREKRNLQKEVEKLKETVSAMTRDAKLQVRRCRNPTCEHCKGSDRMTRSLSKGKLSLRELHGAKDFQASFKRDILKVDRQLAAPKLDAHQEDEEERELLKSLGNRKNQGEEADHLRKPGIVEDAAESSNAPRARSGECSKGLAQSFTKELLVKQQQDFESELASILKRVGMLKQRSHSGSSRGKPGILSKEIHLPIDAKAPPKPSVDETELDLQFGEVEVEKKPPVMEPVANAAKGEDSAPSENCSAMDHAGDHVSAKSGDGLVPQDGQGASVSAEESLEAVDGDVDSGEIQAEAAQPAKGIDHDEGEQASSNDQKVSAEEIPKGAVDELPKVGEGEAGLLTGFDMRLPEEQTGQESLDSGMQREEELPETAHEDDRMKETEPHTVSAERREVESNIAEVETASSAPAHHGVSAPDLAPEAKVHALKTNSTEEEESRKCDEYSEDPESEENVDIADVDPTDTESHPVKQEVKRADEGHEQVVEVVRLGNLTEASEDTQGAFSEHNTGMLSAQNDSCSVGASEQVHQDHTEQDDWGRQNPPNPKGEVQEQQDIPVFERSHVDDPATELPEPDEKRVCGPEVLESYAARSTDELSSGVAEMQCQPVNDKFIDTSRASTEAVEGEKAAVVADDVGFVTDEKPNSEKPMEHPQDPDVQDSVPLLT